MSLQNKYENLSAKHLKDLEFLQKEYPYFAVPFGVTAKKMQELPQFDSDLLQAALRSKDKNALRKFIELSVLQDTEPKKELVLTPVFSKTEETEAVVNPLSEQTQAEKTVENAEIPVENSGLSTEEKIETNDFEQEITTGHNNSKSYTNQIDEPKSFTNWLSFLESETEEKQTEIATEKKAAKDELEQLIAANAQLALFARTIEEETHYAKDLTSFLAREKRKKQKKAAPKDKEIVSETLAKLYEAQGFKDRAIEVYEKLCLKNPEKSAFFASQIENLKK